MCSQTHSIVVTFKPSNKHWQCEGLKYNYAPSNIIKIFIPRPLQCPDKLIYYERSSTNNNKYLKLANGMTGKLRSLQVVHRVFLQGKAQSSKSTMLRLPNVVVHHCSSRKSCCSKRAIYTRLAYWTLLARQVRATTKMVEEWTTCYP